ncbi:MAG: hypothetical protein AB1805_07560 [Nitrospirota bacterium]
MPEKVPVKKVPIFRAGVHVDSNGNRREWTVDDLDSMVKNFDLSEFIPAIVVGHPKVEDPRYGDFDAVYREGKTLFADVDVIPEMHDAWKKGLYPERSVRIVKLDDGTYKIRHLGLLGAHPPAVTGLPRVEFSAEDGEEVIIDFSEYRFPVVGRVLRRLREFYIEKFGVEEADRIVNEYELEDLQRVEPEAVSSAAFSEPTQGGGDMPTQREQELEQQLAEERRKSADFSEKLKQKDAEVATANQKTTVLLAENRKKEFSSFCEGLRNEGKLPPAVMPKVLDFMEILSGVETFDFAEGDGKKAAKPVEMFKEFLSGLGKVIEFGEHATKTKVGDAGNKDREALISDFMEKNKDASYKEAVLAVSKDHPELFKEEV